MGQEGGVVQILGPGGTDLDAGVALDADAGAGVRGIGGDRAHGAYSGAQAALVALVRVGLWGGL